MTPQLYAALTVFVIGIISFLIGWYLTGTSWKKKYYELDRLSKINANKINELEQSINRAKLREQEDKEKLRIANASLAEKEEQLYQLKHTLDGYMAEGYSKSEYNKVVTQLKAANERAELLANQAKSSISGGTNRRVSTTTYKRTAGTKTSPTLSNQNGPAPLNRFLSPLPSYDDPLAPILERIAIFDQSINQDDLSEIEGINHELSAKLHKVGFVNFKQIAMLTEKDLQTISEAVGIPNGYAMEHSWVAHARKLYHRKYEMA